MTKKEFPDPFPTLDKLIALGDLHSDCAKMYRNDRANALEFLADCAEQCQNTNISAYWGKELSSEILQFVDETRNNAANYRVDI